MPPVALTGTPGTGKSTVAGRLAPDLTMIEVGELALRLGTGRRRGRSFTVDLPATVRALRRCPPIAEDLVVGHLAHLLPFRDAVVLRCHPRELAHRLARARRGTARERRANLVAEATDMVLVEAVELKRRVWEVDTTGRTPSAVAQEVAARLARKGRSSYGTVDWLADAWVSEHLLDWSP